MVDRPDTAPASRLSAPDVQKDSLKGDRAMYYGPDKTFCTPASKAKKGDRVNCHESGWKTIAKVKKDRFGFDVIFTDGTSYQCRTDDRLDII